jgi:hypothetical protein
MKRLSAAFLILAFAFIDCSHPPKLYSRARLEKWIADSLQRIDSIHTARRVADSSRVADSLAVVRYGESDSMLAAERRQEEKEAAEIQFLGKVGDTVSIQISAPIDDISGRTIAIDPKNPYVNAIDSLQKVVDAINGSIHDNDGRFKEMKAFPISEKKRYIDFLLKNKMKDTAAVLTYCNSLAAMYKVKYELLVAIKNSQDANTKKFMQYHIEKHQRKMAELNNFILSMTPKVPFYPQREVHKLTPE